MGQLEVGLRDGRWSKEPITIRTGLLAETDNPTTWCDFESSIDNYKQAGCDGIGLCRTGDQVFIDLDGVLDSTGARCGRRLWCKFRARRDSVGLLSLIEEGFRLCN